MKVHKDFIETCVLLHSFFNDYEKTALWLNTNNLNFGGLSPLYLIKIGRGHKVLSFIRTALDENKL